MTRAEEMVIALAPVREALLARAQAAADKEVAGAESDARRAVADAREEARRIVEEGRRSGAADAASAAAVADLHAYREARGVVLAAERQAYEDLVTACQSEVRSLGSGPDGPRVKERLAELAREAVGGDAVVRVTDDGVVAETDSLRVVLTLDELARQRANQVVGDLSELWAGSP